MTTSLVRDPPISATLLYVKCRYDEAKTQTNWIESARFGETNPNPEERYRTLQSLRAGTPEKRSVEIQNEFDSILLRTETAYNTYVASVSSKDFQPINQWSIDAQDAKYIVDESGKRYFKESKTVVRLKSAALSVATLPVHIMGLIYKALKIISFCHFWTEKKGELSYSFKARALDAGKDLLRVALWPIAYLGLQLSALYGIISPYNGRKLYGSFERAEYDSFVLAPCFQPQGIHDDQCPHLGHLFMKDGIKIMGAQW